jgi:DNA-binding response OmpR family regulator
MARIPIVEDMPTEADLLTLLVESEGHTVDVAARAVRARVRELLS